MDENIIIFLKTHISDKTYIGTKYSKNSYKDGANGFSGWVNSAGAGMDCEGFIDNVLKQCGASHPMSVGGGGKAGLLIIIIMDYRITITAQKRIC